MSGWAVLVMALWLLTLCVWLTASPSARDAVGTIRAWWRTHGLPERVIIILFIALAASYGGSKSPAPITKLLRLLFWDHSLTWALTPAQQHTEAAEAANVETAAALDVVEAVTNEVCTISFDWHVPDRLPYHERQNVMAWTARVVPTNIADVLYEDHYVTFNAGASTNPAVILIEYAGKDEDGAVVRYSAAVVTNSYPATSVVTLQSGSYTCYWFRCAVPLPFVSSTRDWNGEALFGSPAESGKGFDLLGTLVVDDGDNVWVGATTNIILGGVANEFRNGINVRAKE